MARPRSPEPPRSELSDPGGWYAAHGRRLYLYAYSRVRDANEADELVHQTLLTAFAARGRFRGESSELTWMTGILRYKVLEHFRRRSRDRCLEPIDISDARKDSPERKAEASEFDSIVREGLGTLSPQMARAFSLRRIEGVSQQEAAKILGVPAGRVAVMVYRARMRLIRHLGQAAAVVALLSAVAVPGAFAAPVGSIEIEGAKTRPETVRALLDTRIGAEFDPAAWERDLRRLRNLDYFYDVMGDAREVDGRMELHLHLRNKFSTLPIFKFKRGGGSSLITAGLYEINFLDRLLEVGGQYERFNGKPGYALWFRHPYLFSRRNRFGTEVLAHAIDLPLLTDRGEEEAFFENKETRWNGRLQRELAESLRVGVELSVYQNDFKRDDGSAEKRARNDGFLRTTTLHSGRTVSLTPSVTVGRLDHDRYFISGHEGFAQVELAHRSLGSGFAFAKGQAGVTGGWRPGERWNLVYQAKLGSKTGREFQHKFYLGGLDTARGFLDRQFRGEHMWLVNLEARPTLVEKPLWVLQGALFTDLAKTWDARNFGVDGFGRPIISYGIGGRVIFPRVYRAILRLDVARTQRPVGQYGVSLGLQQFF
ncbi:MAG: sigma-70 family RNA polymerase sigma factor [Elusimicrobia bacterium]|nr:sigma-70 family RNA polymerase sigma factor [Elusimicrobiota bacterium]